MSSYFPLGGLVSGSSVILAFFEKSANAFWVLTQTDIYDYNLIFRSAITIDSNGVVTTDADTVANVAIFTTSISSAGSLQLMPDFNFIAVAGSGNVAVNGSTPASLTYAQTQIQDWSNPPQVVTGVPYTLTGGGASLSFLFDDGSITGLIRQISPYFIPTTAFFGCTSKITNQMSNISDLIRLSYCSATNILGTSACGGLPLAAWTTQSDCMNGFIYKYCQPGVYCSGRCQSTCQIDGQVCAYLADNVVLTVPDAAPEGANGTIIIPRLSYTCQNQQNPTGPTNAFGTSWWVIVVIIIIAIIVIALLILIYKRIISDSAKKDGATAGVSTDTSINVVDGDQNAVSSDVPHSEATPV